MHGQLGVMDQARLDVVRARNDLSKLGSAAVWSSAPPHRAPRKPTFSQKIFHARKLSVNRWPLSLISVIDRCG